MVKHRMACAALIGAAALGGAYLSAHAEAPQARVGPALAVTADGGTLVGYGKVKLGKPVYTMQLPSPAGATYSLAGDRGKKATVLLFVSTECPVSNAYNARMAKLAQDYSSKGVRFLAVNSNRSESAEVIDKHAKANKFTFPVLMDIGNVAADYYDARVTPQVYVLDGEGVLRYRGRIDDKQQPERVKSKDLRVALDALLAGKPVPVAETRAFGCSIKRMKESDS